MSEETQRNEITRRPVVLKVPGMEDVEVQEDIVYTEDTEHEEGTEGTLVFDLYMPPRSEDDARPPVVVLICGYPDPGYERLLGCRQKEVASYVSWARLLAVGGLAVVAYANNDPVEDLSRLWEFLRGNAGDLGVDASRVAIWACSGSVPLALSWLTGPSGDEVICAALCYGYMFDRDGETAVADTAAAYGFASPGGAVKDLSPGTPLMVVRAGQDEMPGLNASVDGFIEDAMANDLPLALINHPAAPHAFDIHDDSDRTRTVIHQVLEFLGLHLGVDRVAGRQEAGCMMSKQSTIDPEPRP